MSHRKLRLGVIGCGDIFREQHLPYYQQTELAEVLAVADVDPARAKKTAGELGAPFHSDNPNDIIKRDDLDAVDIATRPASHCELAVAAAGAGKHVLVEKPMCLDVAEADEMIAAAEKAKVKLQVAYVFRFHPAFRRVRQMLESGTIGDLVSLRLTSASRPASSDRSWRKRAAESGGMFLESTIHWLDVFLWWGGPVQTVAAVKKTRAPDAAGETVEGAVESEFGCVLQFEHGAIASLTQSWSSRLPAFEAGVVGTTGAVNVTRTDEGETAWATIGRKEKKPTIKTYADGPEPKGRCIEHFLKCILEDTEPPASGAAGRAGVELAQAAYVAAEQQKVVKLPLKTA